MCYYFDRGIPAMKRTFFLIFILCSGIFLRFWHFSELFYFAIDEEKAAFIIRDIANLSHFPAAGHPSSIGFRLGPLMYYLISPVYWLFSPSPIVWGYLGIAISAISMMLIYRLGAIISHRAGLLSLLLYAYSYFTVLYDRRGWQLTFHSLITLTVLYCLLRIRSGRLRYWYILTAALIAASQFEVALVLLFPFVFIILVIERPNLPFRHIFICLTALVLSHIPLFVFDLRHDFLNTRYLLNYFHEDAEIRISENVPLTGIRDRYLAHNLIPATFSRMLFPGSDTNIAVQYANCPQYLAHKHRQISPAVVWPVVLFFFWLFLYAMRNRTRSKTPKETIMRTAAVLFLVLFGATALYTYGFDGEMAEYYFLTGHAYFFLVLGIVLSQIWKTRWCWTVVLFLSLFIVHNSGKIFQSTNPYGFTEKTAAVRWAIEQTEQKPFILDSFQTCWYSGGYRYLFSLLGKEPRTSYMDQYMSEYYTPDTATVPEYIVTILTPELIGEQPARYDAFREKTIREADNRQTFGAIEVYVNRL